MIQLIDTRDNNVWLCGIDGARSLGGRPDVHTRLTTAGIPAAFDDGTLVDLTDAEVELVLEDSAGAPTIRLPMVILSGGQSVVRYHRRRGDIPRTVRATANREEAGEYLSGHVRVDWEDGTFLEWPLDRRLNVEIR